MKGVTAGSLYGCVILKSISNAVRLYNTNISTASKPRNRRPLKGQAEAWREVCRGKVLGQREQAGKPMQERVVRRPYMSKPTQSVEEMSQAAVTTENVSYDKITWGDSYRRLMRILVS